jgi:hypothetical protein
VHQVDQITLLEYLLRMRRRGATLNHLDDRARRASLHIGRHYPVFREIDFSQLRIEGSVTRVVLGRLIGVSDIG